MDMLWEAHAMDGGEAFILQLMLVATWQTKYRYSEQTGLLSIFVNSNGQGWAVGYRGVIYKTENDGSSWSQILSGTQVGYTGDWITSVFMINDSVGWAGWL